MLIITIANVQLISEETKEKGKKLLNVFKDNKKGKDFVSLPLNALV